MNIESEIKNVILNELITFYDMGVKFPTLEIKYEEHAYEITKKIMDIFKKWKD